MSKITADAHELATQGRWSAMENLRYAVDEIDSTMGKGYCKAHPELLGSVILASAIDYHGSVLAKYMNELSEGLNENIGYISDAIENSKK